MELVGDQDTDIAGRAVAQGEIGDDLGCRAHDRRIRIDRRVAGQQADVVGTERGAQVEELLADQRLDGAV